MSIRRFSLSLAACVLMAIPSIAEAGRIIWPCTGRVTSDYGPRTSPCSGCSTYHHGIDIGVGSGTVLGSPGNGTVKSYTWSSCSGNMYVIGYENGWESRFHHSSGSIKAVGSAVTRNVNVAYSGGTGSCTTGPHLHFEMRKDGVSQSVPGAVGITVTRNTEIPKDFAGLNDPAPVTVTVDNTSAGFSASTGWATSTSAADKYGTSYRYKSTAAVSDAAEWTASLSSGTYNIYAWWPAGTNRSTTAPYILPDGAVVNKNQQANGGKWNLLASRSLSGSVTTKLSCWTTTGFVVVADAIRYVK